MAILKANATLISIFDQEFTNQTTKVTTVSHKANIELDDEIFTFNISPQVDIETLKKFKYKPVGLKLSLKIINNNTYLRIVGFDKN